MATDATLSAHLGAPSAAPAAPSAAPAAPSTARRLARYAVHTGRVLLGLQFLIAGLNYFVPFLPMPSDPGPAGAMAFGAALFQSGYMFPLIKGTEVLAGALLVFNRWVPLALVLLAPVTVNIVAFHAFLAPSGLALAIVLATVQLALAWAYRRSYAPLFAPRTTPDA